MKTVITILLVILIGFSQVAFCEAKRPIAAVKDLVGIVKLQSADSNKKSALTAGTLLFNGDRLITEKSAMVAILFTDGSLLKVKDLSDVTLTATPIGEGRLDTKVDLPLGELWAKVTRRDSKFEIVTPSSVASVKGTEFFVLVEGDGMSLLFVLDGTVEFRNEEGRVLVKKNQRSIARKNRPPTIPKRMSREERKFNFERNSSLKDRSEKKPSELDKSRQAATTQPGEAGQVISEADRYELDFEQEKEAEASTIWQLQIETPAEPQVPNKYFMIGIKAVDIETGDKDFRCNTQLVVFSSTTGAQFSLDGTYWTGELNTTLSSGELEIAALARSEEDMSINVLGKNCRPASAAVRIEKTSEQRVQEAEKIESIIKIAGIEGMSDLDYSSGQVLEGGWNLDEILDKIESGELEIVSEEVFDLPDGGKRIVLRLRPSEISGGGP